MKLLCTVYIYVNVAVAFCIEGLDIYRRNNQCGVKDALEGSGNA